MNDQKKLWDKLAKRNSKYYINSDHGKGISEEEFRESGKNDYFKFILEDDYLDDFDSTKKVILDLGCGTGRFTELMSYDFRGVVGVDISGEMIEQGWKRLRLKGIENVDLIETDGYTLPLADDYFDYAFSYLVFQHFKTQEMVESNFREVYRVLKPGGIFKVRVRTDKIDSMDPWWAGVACDETYSLSIGFKLLKEKKVEHYGKWLWLQK